MRILLLIAALIATRFALGVPLDALGVPSLITGLVVGAALIAVYVRIRRRPAALARPALPGLVLGGALGFGLFTVTVLIIATFGMFRVDGFGSFGAMLSALGVAILAGVFEELLIRGVLFPLLEGRLGTWWALGLSALVFGGLHLVNLGANLVSALGIALEAGVLLGLAYVATRSLWLPIGLHTAWNFTQSGIFGVPTSGVAQPGLLESHLSGPAFLSGGDFGVEGSLFAVLTCLALSVVLYRRARATLKPRPRARRTTVTG